ncbi:MAG: radical SAM protein [Nanoarchaeota archaeon]
MVIKRTSYHSWKKGELAKGCMSCVKGEKMVVFITGVCNNKCFYCPVSEQKNLKDVVYANEWNAKFVGRFDEPLKRGELNVFFEEARLTEARGCGITGGDPLLVPKRTASLIRALKKKFGKKFHIHLYTPLRNLTKEKLRLLAKAGLDEIRFHPDVWDKKFWDRIDWAKHYQWTIGVEIPALPGFEKQTKELCDFIEDKISFLNLNELEISDTNASDLVGKGFLPKDRISYGVKGSEAVAKRLLRYCEKKHYSVHYCTTKLKDSVQLAQRMKRRSKNARLKTDIVTEDGMLVRGVIYLKKTEPTFSYRKRIFSFSEKEREKVLARLEKTKELLVKEYKILPSHVTIDNLKLRILTSERIVRMLSPILKKKKLLPAVVEEYPTWDGMEIEVEML